MDLVVPFVYEDLESHKDTYLKYHLYNKEKGIGGKLILEKYEDRWTLEEIEVTPRNQGYGSIFLQHVLSKENLDPKDIKVCLRFEKNRRFFIKNGFSNIVT